MINGLPGRSITQQSQQLHGFKKSLIILKWHIDFFKFTVFFTDAIIFSKGTRPAQITIRGEKIIGDKYRHSTWLTVWGIGSRGNRVCGRDFAAGHGGGTREIGPEYRINPKGSTVK